MADWLNSTINLLRYFANHTKSYFFLSSSSADSWIAANASVKTLFRARSTNTSSLVVGGEEAGDTAFFVVVPTLLAGILSVHDEVVGARCGEKLRSFHYSFFLL
jgi:hypothetical protein